MRRAQDPEGQDQTGRPSQMPATGDSRATTSTTAANTSQIGNDRLLFGMILGVLAFWLFAQTTLNIAPTMGSDLGVETNVMNIAVSITALLSGIFIVVFGIGLAFYATPSTDAAISNLPDDQAGSGSGIYKMASSLGASFGVAISAVIFTALSSSNSSADWIAGMITFAGRQDNLGLREAALVAFGANLLMVVAAIITIVLTVPKGKLHEEVPK